MPADAPSRNRAQVDWKQADAVTLFTTDLNGIPRGKLIPVSKILADPDKTVRISDAVLMADYSGLPVAAPPDDGRWWPSWADGYGDLRVIPDHQTGRLVPWRERSALVICDLQHLDGRDVMSQPRAVVRRLERRLADLGYETKVSAELEFVLFRETDHTAHQKGYRSLSPFVPIGQTYGLTRSQLDDDPMRHLVHQLSEFGCAVEGWSAEAGRGQIEINLEAETATAAGDTACLFKHAVKEVSAANGLFATFMPKLSAKGVGNGLHLNHSLWTDGEPAFHDPDQPGGRSATLGMALAGQQATLSEFMPMFAPTVTSYRRFLPYYAAGTTVSWGLDNKSVSLRTVTELPRLTRIENRVSGADANPYVVIAACLAGCLFGIEQGLEVGAPVEGDAYADGSLQSLPTNPREALNMFEQSPVANEYLGEEFVRFFGATRRAELDAFAKAVPDGAGDEVTDWELRRYAGVV